MRRLSIAVPALASLLGILPPACAQQEQRSTLTPAQVEQIREAGIDPNGRIKLYTKFLDEHAQNIEELSRRGHSVARAHRLDNELQNFSALLDELGSNLDQYGDRKADMRKALKGLNEAAQHWLAMLRSLPSEPIFDLSLKDAIDAGQDMVSQAGQMLTDQTAYFKEHKDQRGQDRAEPQ